MPRLPAALSSQAQMETPRAIRSLGLLGRSDGGGYRMEEELLNGGGALRTGNSSAGRPSRARPGVEVERTRSEEKVPPSGDCVSGSHSERQTEWCSLRKGPLRWIQRNPGKSKDTHPGPGASPDRCRPEEGNAREVKGRSEDFRPHYRRLRSAPAGTHRGVRLVSSRVPSPTWL